MNGFEYIKNNLADLNKEISELAEKVGHKVTLVAVTKSGSDDELLALAGFGAADIG